MVLSINDLPINPRLRDALLKRGFQTLYPPQEDAVNAGLFNGEDILLCTSTGTGKTLLANVLALDTVLTRHAKAVYLVPTRALARERGEWLRDLGKELGVRVSIRTGDFDKPEDITRTDVLVATYEKFDSMLRHNPNWLGDIGTIVLDEVHLIGEARRGPIVESIMATLRHRGVRAQVLGLSATVGNPGVIADYLGARLVTSDWRPVPLYEGVYKHGTIHCGDGKKRGLSSEAWKAVGKLVDNGNNNGNERVEPNPVVLLALDTILNGGQVLVFTTRRILARTYAFELAKALRKLGLAPRRDVIKPWLDRLKEAGGEYRSLVANMGDLFSAGVAYHHAGLGGDIRRVVEDAFNNHVLSVVVATTTLAVGVNMPARRVIIADRFLMDYEAGGERELSVIEYKQMAGRAGRPGLDPYGEAIIIARYGESVDMLIDRYIKGKPESVVSRLKDSLGDFLLGQFASNRVSSINDAVELMRHTLAVHQGRLDIIEVLMTIKGLVRMGFLEERGTVLVPTRFGRTVALSYLGTRTGRLFRAGIASAGGSYPGDFSVLALLAMAREAYPLVQVYDKEERRMYFKYYLQHHREFLIDPGEVYRNGDGSIDEYEVASIVKTSLALTDWINEVDEDVISSKYGIGPGDLDGLKDTFSWLAASIARIAENLDVGWYRELYTLSDRIKYGVKPELVPLMRVYKGSGLGRKLVRNLYNAGYRTLEDIARASPRDIRDRVEGFGEARARRAIEVARRALGWSDRVPGRVSILDYLK